MVEISTFKDLEKWDKDRPIEWSKVIAFRVITRVVFSLVYQEKATILTSLNDEEILFHGFRTLFISDNIISHPEMLNELKHYSYAAYSSIVTQRHVSGVEARFTVPAANVAYLSSLTENDTGSFNSIIRDALEVIKTQLGLDGRYTYGTGHRGTNLSHKVFRGSDWTQFVFKDLNNDINKLTNGMHPCDLMLEPLFMKNDIFKNPVYNKYIYARRKLLSDQGKWNFWIDWYQAKLDGTLHSGLTQVQQDELYYQIATFPNELWEEGAKAVNQRITQLMEKLKIYWDLDLEEKSDESLEIEIPPQNKGALQFKTNEDGVIELDKEVNENELLNDQDAIDRHNEVDFLANELISSYDPNSSSANSAKPIVTKVQRYLEALGETPGEANVNFIIPRGEVLRQELEREENRDEFTNSPPLPDNFKSSLASLVGTHNIYVLLDPVLDKRDQARLGPDAKENLVSKEEGLKFVEGAFNEGLIEEEIVEVFNEEAETVRETPDLDRRQDRRFSESIKNLSRLLLSNTQKIAKKIKENQADIIEVATASGLGAGTGLLLINATWTIIGGAIGVGVTCFKGLQWVVKNEEWIIHHFDNKEEVKAFIEALKKWPIK